MLISIIIPVYNSEKYLKECLNSVLLQTFRDFEVILVNDGSSDSSGEICDYFVASDSRFNVYHKENGGVSAARNFGIEKANGQWVCFVDSDDFVGKDFLLDFKNLEDDSSIDLYVQGYTELRDGCSPKLKPIIDGDYISDNIGNELFFLEKKTFMVENPWGKLFKRQILVDQLLRFDENLSNGEDHLFVLIYFKNVEKILISSGFSYYYRRFSSLNALTSQKIHHSKFSYYTDQIFTQRKNNMSIHSIDVEYLKFAISSYYHNIFVSIKLLYQDDSSIKNSERITLLKNYLLKITDVKIKKGRGQQLVKLFSILPFPFNDKLIEIFIKNAK